MYSAEKSHCIGLHVIHYLGGDRIDRIDALRTHIRIHIYPIPSFGRAAGIRMEDRQQLLFFPIIIFLLMALRSNYMRSTLDDSSSPVHLQGPQVSNTRWHHVYNHYRTSDRKVLGE